MLNIWSNPDSRLNDSSIAFLAGYLEGYITRELINYHFHNVWSTYCNEHETFCIKVFDFYKQNIQFMRNKVETESKVNPFWYQVGLILEQITGLEEGMKQTSIFRSETRFDQLEIGKIFILNSIPDLWELESVLGRAIKSKDRGKTTCSAIIKLLPNDLIVGHNTWLEFSQMLRILKKYDLSYRTGSSEHSNVVPGQIISMSSYPGLIFSLDDYYLLSSGLVVTETTNVNFNLTSFQLVKPTSVFCFVRMMVANRLAVDGSSWSRIFAQYNSGTYNNQFMIIDYKRYQANSFNQKPGLFWILEQMPDFFIAKDMTSALVTNKYWASYNIPYFEDTYLIAGYPMLRNAYGPFFDHHETVRAKQFRRKQDQANDYKSVLKLLRYNNYTQDIDTQCDVCKPPYSATVSLASRGDLNDPNGSYSIPIYGLINETAIDVKVTSYELFKQFKMYAISGPTYEDVPPFIWSNSSLKYEILHEGHPDVWIFSPIYF
uniref:Phospholipase B-like n=2 Tax=Tetranychus urticae TaxID=32264 RepID=T1K1P8_TETUR